MSNKWVHFPLARYLYGFEEYCRSASITFRTIHHNNPRTVTSSSNQRHLGAELREASFRPEKVESMDEKAEEGPDIKIEKEVKDRQMSPRVRRMQARLYWSVGAEWF